MVIAGGVAANLYLRNKLIKIIKNKNKECYFPPLDLCTDNGAMIAWAGYERYREGLLNSCDFAVRPRWPLEERKSL